MLYSSHMFQVIDSNTKKTHLLHVVPDQHGCIIGIEGAAQILVLDVSEGALRDHVSRSTPNDTVSDDLVDSRPVARLPVGEEDVGQEVQNPGG